MEPQPPYSIIDISKEPILKGSEEDDMPPMSRAGCQQYKQKVVFPLSAIARDSGWLLSCGINDAGVALVKIQPGDLKI
jgi:hypothetical protein